MTNPTWRLPEFLRGPNYCPYTCLTSALPLSRHLSPRDRATIFLLGCVRICLHCLYLYHIYAGCHSDQRGCNMPHYWYVGDCKHLNMSVRNQTQINKYFLYLSHQKLYHVICFWLVLPELKLKVSYMLTKDCTHSAVPSVPMLCLLNFLNTFYLHMQVYQDMLHLRRSLWLPGATAGVCRPTDVGSWKLNPDLQQVLLTLSHLKPAPVL